MVVGRSGTHHGCVGVAWGGRRARRQCAGAARGLADVPWWRPQRCSRSRLLGRHMDEPASGVAVGARAEEGRRDCNGGEPEVKWG
jgi:hypothetical protein